MALTKEKKMKSDDEIIKDLNEIDQQTIDVVCDILRQYSIKKSMYLANIVASVCDIEADEMLTDTTHIQNSHARWLFWYAYRYMTKESYDSIAKKTATKRKFTVGSIGYCVTKMSMMVESEPIWIKRWSIVKRVIKAILENNNNITDKTQETVTLKVQPPKGIDVKLQVIK